MIGPRKTRKNQIVIHYLLKWFDLDRNINFLSSVEEVQIKILYSALKELEPTERKFLADKYRVQKKPYKTDTFLADECDIPLEDYKLKRRGLEDKLKPILEKYREQYSEELRKAIDVQYRRY